MNLSTAHCYIIDDDQSFGKSLKRLLYTKGIAADYFQSAQSFLDSVPPGQEGCAIIDIHMPDCNGFALIGKMKTLHYGMSVIVITGHAQGDVRDQAMRQGAIGFLQKPFSEESLLDLLNSDD